MIVGRGAGRRDRRRARSREALARAAMDLFRRQGFVATTVGAIAEAADCSASTFFRLFESKEDVVFFDLEESLGVATRHVATAAAGGDWSAIREVILRHASAWEEDADFAAARVRIIHDEPVVHRRYLQYVEAWQGDLADRLAECRGLSPTDDVLAFVAAAAVVATYRAAFRRQAHSGGTLAGHLEDALDLVESRGAVSALLAQHRAGSPA